MALRPVVVPANPANYSPRRGMRVDTVILHTTEGTSTGTLAWFQNAQARCSAHYLVGRTGRVWQMVPEDEAAWHAGNWAWNARSIGIEVEGKSADHATWGFEAVAALVEILTDVCRRHSIAPTRANVLGHNEVPDPLKPGKFGGAGNHTDPGPHIPWERILGGVAANLKSEGIA